MKIDLPGPHKFVRNGTMDQSEFDRIVSNWERKNAQYVFGSAHSIEPNIPLKKEKVMVQEDEPKVEFISYDDMFMEALKVLPPSCTNMKKFIGGK